MKTVKIYAPATIANIAAGFDVLGLAIDSPGDIIVAARSEEPGLTFSLADATISLPTQNNVAAHVASLMLSELKPDFGVEMLLHKFMPVGSGLGSSGASSAAAAMAINELLPHPMPRMELIRFAIEGERLASGAAHADNVAPSLLGGVCLVRSDNPLHVVQLPIKSQLYWVVVHPQLEVPTREARACLPSLIPLKMAVAQWGNVGGLVAGIVMGDDDLIAQSLNDYIAEPVRSTLITGYYAVKRAALDAGALGFSISGSGPSVFAVVKSKEEGVKIGEVIKQAFRRYAEVESTAFVSKINEKGARLLEENDDGIYGHPRTIY